MAINQIAIALGNKIRLSMLLLMLEGRYFTAKELAYGAEIQPAAATAHLKVLLDSQLIICFPQGRFKYFALANEEVAQILETMLYLAPTIKVKRKLPQEEMCQARFCYNHLAGKLGVALYQQLHALQYIQSHVDSKEVKITALGYKWLQQAGIWQTEQKVKRKMAVKCLDWSERTPHLAGHLGTLLAEYFIKQQWVVKQKDSRILKITLLGKTALTQQFGINWNF
ncbi:winged helix-turn-helix transcriptional regulator [Testudinibacter sp. TR-2022]|uniref:ArsR/SmtB family transcription factor n=1 Tax=Testudinibacter sp. TR-2022 TaxID=2585029 RepID=UPI0011192048|nr:winged helix-turn-helix domain-containing protein [Testudinibacter sp. TR-2022]TNH05302.1 winged helix-turn-helix transcriptional regulator [Pasteurellaceae bacterium Phil31]TNH07831.1 winged helix-turn-helix transcriptional regulator [Testudinibacter sp. TR-2022]TNH09088.1 winged helix-turn-helix transcriptional regulator [Testudinibacter sp. TR-2022]TNH14314.1 winged helix-turn-helix transcriptional regulator [Testudinibacter sp. TR-2022]TNH20473.1 winged helix-turn-helix transcriptional 